MNAIALYDRKTDAFDARVAHAIEVLRAAAAAHPGTAVQATSLGAEDMVLTDLIAKHHIAITLGTLETGVLHAETVALIPRIEAQYGLKVAVYRPETEAVIQFVKTNGEKAMYDSIELRKACCGIRKMEPLSRMLAGQTAWVTGLRREQSNNRGEVPFSEPDDKGRTKYNPLADWTWNDVWHYIAAYNVPYNPLHDEFMPSIGCAPCTRAIAVGEDFRAGRWWWESEDAKECGLHVKTHDDDAPASSVLPSKTAGVLASATANFGATEVKGSTEPGQSHDEKAKECGLHVKEEPAAQVSMIGDRP